eukprot:s933_g9.t1
MKREDPPAVTPDHVACTPSSLGVADQSPEVGMKTNRNSETPAMAGGLEFHWKEVDFSSKLSLAGLRFSELGPYFLDGLRSHVWSRHSKTLSTAQGNLFPLPLRGYPNVGAEIESWLAVVMLALNSMYGAEAQTVTAPTQSQQKIAEVALSFLNRMCKLEEVVPDTPFRELFMVRGVDYRGEEIKLAKPFSWNSIAGALPSEVGSLELEAFCTGSCLHYVQNFSDFLLPEDMQSLGRVPQVMVAEEDWFDVCKGLLDAGICGILPQRELHHVGNQPLLNGLFSGSKNEVVNNQELHRLIMNMVPVNRLSRSFQGDTGTLPTIAGFNAFYLEDSEVAVLGSEDIKCFYYLFRLPLSWHPYMGFAKPLPASLVPPCWEGEVCHLIALVLPMGFINSVGLAQHIHRNVVRWSMQTGNGAERELRRDKPPTHAKDLFRVYLDNWDEVRKVDKSLADEVEGRPSPAQVALRQQYSELALPRHPKKAVEGSYLAEVQGAYIDGVAGVAFARPSKILKYVGLAWEVVAKGAATMKELQVVAGGLVYISMFRRALLCGLNAIWAHIESLKGDPPVVRRPLPREVKAELLRFCALIPLAQMDFRAPMNGQVTASDASSLGGGICASVGLTSFGEAAQAAPVRGELAEPFDDIQVLTVGLFDGIGALRVASDVLRLPSAGHISVECNQHANRVVESWFPGVHLVSTVQEVTEEEVMSWACQYRAVGVVLLGAGPPCQDVSGLNADRKGSQVGLRSRLYKEVPRVRRLLQRCFPWAQVHTFMESVASMDASDRAAMSEEIGLPGARVVCPTWSTPGYLHHIPPFGYTRLSLAFLLTTRSNVYLSLSGWGMPTWISEKPCWGILGRFEQLGLIPKLSIQEVVSRTTPGAGSSLQAILQRPPVRRETPTVVPDNGLTRRLAGLVSVKGEDLLLQAPSEQVVKYHRLRSSIPAKLWKWTDIAGWRWRGDSEHINSLELRATFTTVRWLIQKKRCFNCRFLHLTDSLVVLHALSRGRSSSRRLRRTLMRSEEQAAELSRLRGSRTGSKEDPDADGDDEALVTKTAPASAASEIPESLWREPPSSSSTRAAPQEETQPKIEKELKEAAAVKDSTITVKTGDKEISIQIGKELSTSSTSLQMRGADQVGDGDSEVSTTQALREEQQT